MMQAIVSTASFGYKPLAVSAESMTQSVPSRTALATSLHSALVGRGRSVMESSICVLVTTGLPARLAQRMMAFCARKSLESGSSMPRSPRDTCTPSASARISWMLRRPSTDSIFACTRILRPFSLRQARRERTLAAVRMNEPETMSTSYLRAKCSKSYRSLSVMPSRRMETPGIFMFLRSSRSALFSTRTMTDFSRTSIIVQLMDPSAIRIVPPTSADSHRFL
mmetsp:Transcript_23298/g.66183  ORF Transcript_23298/g.66183 Transcript_23298/m.66183 type:complete len:223 (+) Transcript_23298:611-1279(+)